MTTQGANRIKSAEFLTAPNLTGSKTSNQSSDSTFDVFFNTNTSKNADLGNTSVSKDFKNNPSGESGLKNVTTTDKLSTSDRMIAKDTVKNEGLQDGSKVTEEQNEKVGQLLEDVKEVVKEVLGFSEEELTDCMETLGLTMIDLLNPLALQKLLLASNGTQDIIQFITNEGLSNQLNMLLDSIQGLIKDSGFTVEQLQSILTSDSFTSYLEEAGLSSQADVNVHAEQVEVGNTKDLSESNDNVNKASDAAVESENGSGEKKEISFMVEKSTTKDSSTEDQASKDSQSGMESNNENTVNVDDFLQQVSTSVTKMESSFSGQLTEVTTIREIANQIVEQIKVVIKPTQTSMEMQLNPENLGKVNLMISSKEGVMTAQFTTQSVLAKEAIESQMQVLKQNLENQGIKVEAIEVTVSDFGFSQKGEAGSEQNSGESKQRKAFVYDTEEEVTVFEDSRELASGLIDENISNVDYTA